MMVIFTSRSEKKATGTVRKILDSFAERIGNDTWKTIITEKGLETVKILLRKSATKNMAVACHWMRSRSHSELIWIVGNRDKFNLEGAVPVNTTMKNLNHNEWENNFWYLPQIKALTAMAALFHDWGKASKHFQNKLRENDKKEADIYRHEWVSCRLLATLVAVSGNCKSDDVWLQLLADGLFDEKAVIEKIRELKNDKIAELPPIANLICWLILSHHRLASPEKDKICQYSEIERKDFFSIMDNLDYSWNSNKQVANNDTTEYFCFEKGLLQDSPQWQKVVKKWAGKILEEKDQLLQLLNGKQLRCVLLYSRISLMLADYNVSSQPADCSSEWDDCKLYANTDKNKLKQKLDEHVVKVMEQSLRILHRLSFFVNKMEYARDIKSIKHKSPTAFSWQDKAVAAIKGFRKQHNIDENYQQGWFVVNMASTGCGKTFANAKIMQAISPDENSLRYVAALGLRSLTLQTGDEYAQRIGIGKDELAVIIGSTAVMKLHKEETDEDKDDIDYENLFDGDIDFVETEAVDFLNVIFNGRNAKKNKAFLYKPLLISTIDHIIGATEAIKGGHYILPFLRLMSSDILIDEIDDFSPKDLMAISRLVHLAGMLGRNVLISSATIPPDLAAGMFAAYVAGRRIYAAFSRISLTTAAVWCDEFSAKVKQITGDNYTEGQKDFSFWHNKFIDRRIEKLKQQLVKRKGKIIDCSHILSLTDREEKQRVYFQTIQDSIYDLHDTNCIIDTETNKKVSFGLVRMANIGPCVELGKYLLLEKGPKVNYAIKTMVYHSRQIMLMRNYQERYLDKVLKRKEPEKILQDMEVRKHLNSTMAENVIFVVVATPVEEVGRDHDFDWAVVEPSSYRSIIQLAGRVKRHREVGFCNNPNIAVMQHNMKFFSNDDDSAPCFNRPGFETGGKYTLVSHDMKQIVDEIALQHKIDAEQRIKAPENCAKKNFAKLIDLEHAQMKSFNSLANSGPKNLKGWLSEYWWLTGTAQRISPFRNGEPQLDLYILYRDGRKKVAECDRGDFIERERFYNIEWDESDYGDNAWLDRDYIKLLRQRAEESEDEEKEMEKESEKYGLISIPEAYKKAELIYHDQLGIYKNKK